jgi:phenylalanyl-tRNA synthetase beta chain
VRLPGAKLPGDFTIKIAKVRGIESSGMLCSAKELGIAEEASGLLILPADAPVGQSSASISISTTPCFELKLTPNRADCLSLLGIAREVAAITGAATSLPVVPVAQHRRPARRRARCAGSLPALLRPRHQGRRCQGADAGVDEASPLERSGIRSISGAGRCHQLRDARTRPAAARLRQHQAAGRRACAHGRSQEEKLLLLNEQTIDPIDADVLLIADDAKPLAMAGIMGGEESGITLETANCSSSPPSFAPKAIAGRARRYGFGSDASHRFERGVDFGGTRVPSSAPRN